MFTLKYRLLMIVCIALGLVVSACGSFAPPESCDVDGTADEAEFDQYFTRMWNWSMKPPVSLGSLVRKASPSLLPLSNRRFGSTAWLKSRSKLASRSVEGEARFLSTRPRLCRKARARSRLVHLRRGVTWCG